MHRYRRRLAGAINTLSALRDIVHALRGWPTPLGAAINSAESVFDEEEGVWCREWPRYST